MPESEGKLVLDILDLYRVVSRHIEENPSGKVAEHPWATFHGFDANNEGEYHAFTNFLIHVQKKFQEQLSTETDSFNSHTPCLDKYRSMVEIWDHLEKGIELNEDQVLAILNA